MSIDLQKIKGAQFALILFFSISTIGAGCLYLYLYKESVFLTIDVIKLILLAISITSPLLLFNVINTYMLFRHFTKLEMLEERKNAKNLSIGKDEYNMMRGALTGAYVTLFSYYIPLMFFFKNPLKLETVIKVVLYFNLLYCVIILISDMKISNKIKKLLKEDSSR